MHMPEYSFAPRTKQSPVRGTGARAITLRAVSTACLLTLFAACADDPGITPPVVIAPVSQTIDSLGAVLTEATGAFELTVPKLAVRRATQFTIQPASNPLADARIIPGTAFQVLPETLFFFRTVTFKIKFDPAKLPTNVSAEGLVLYQLYTADWQTASNSSVNVTTRTVTGDIGSGGTYAIGYLPFQTMAFRSSLAGGGVYVGKTGKLSVVLTNDYYDLPPRPITWTSSAPSIATIDATGTVHGITPGITTITATVEGKSITTTVSVLSAPVANWTRAAEWTTYQGNAQHNGFVDAVMDPNAFSLRWEKASPGIFYNQATVGGNRVFLVTGSGARHVTALSAADGTSLWNTGLGPINNSNQATYDSGSVYVTTGGHGDTFMYALNETDGGTRFKTPFLNQWSSYRAPVVAGNAIVTAGGYYGGMYGFERSTGKQLFANAGSQVDGWAPAVLNGVIYSVDGGGVNSTMPSTGAVTKTVVDTRLEYVTTPVIGGANNVLGIWNSRLYNVDLTAKRVSWDQRAVSQFTPVVGNGVVYTFNGGTIDARNESDGTLRWTWTLPAPYTTPRALALTGNLLFASISTGADNIGITVAIDLATHLAVWEFPATGLLSISGQGALYIVQREKISVVNLK